MFLLEKSGFLRKKSLYTVLIGYLELLGFFFSQALKAIMFFGGIALAIICFFIALTSVTDRYQQYQTLLNSSSALLITVSTIFVVFRYFYSHRHKIPLKVVNYFALIFCIAFFVSIAFTVSDLIVPYDKHPKLVGFLFSLISSFSGIALTWVARLEPPIEQQIKYIASKALKEAPNQQLSSIDLIQHLKRNLKLSDDKLLQHLDRCSFLEKIDDHEFKLQFYCFKDKKTTSMFPQLLNISNVTLRSNLKRALSFLDEDNVDIGLFMLGREFEITLKDYLTKAYIKGILVSTPGNKDPKDLKLADLVSCLKSNGIVTDDAALRGCVKWPEELAKEA
jgi:hypothetical protein